MTGFRKNTRLGSWNYDNTSAYHVTFCVKDMQCVLGKIVRNEKLSAGLDPRAVPADSKVRVELSEAGKCTYDAIVHADSGYDGFDVRKFAVMPNHVHILVAVDNSSARATLGRFVGYVKTSAARLAKARNVAPVVWQRGYYDHIIRGENDYALTWKYIDENPARWDEDEYFADWFDA